MLVLSVGRTNPEFPHAHSSSHDQNQLYGLKIASPGCQWCQAPGWERIQPQGGVSIFREEYQLTHSQETPGQAQGLPESRASLSPGADHREQGREEEEVGPESPEGPLPCPPPCLPLFKRLGCGGIYSSSSLTSSVILSRWLPPVSLSFFICPMGLLPRWMVFRVHRTGQVES